MPVIRGGVDASLNETTYEVSDEFSHETLYILVENTLYTLNRMSLLKDSEFFQELFALPPETNKPVEGSSAKYPLRIEGVSEREIVLFLRAMYPRYISPHRGLSREDWVIVLKLLTMWRFTESRRAVLSHLKSRADPVTKVVIYRQNRDLDGEQWLIPAVTALAKRNVPLNVNEAERLGAADSARIAAVRETYRCCCGRTTGTGPPHPPGECQWRMKADFRPAIRKHFLV